MRLQLIALAGLCLALSLTSSGCRTVMVPMNVTKPALINMNPYQNVVVDSVEGDLGANIAQGLRYSMSQGGRFRVIARETMLTGHAPAGTALITGSSQARYDENIDRFESTCNRNGFNYKCFTYTRHGNFSATATIRVTDVRTGQTAGEIELPCAMSDQTQATDANPAPIDTRGFIDSCTNDITSRFIWLLAPHIITVQAHFRKTGDQPLLEQGIEKVKANDLAGALALFQQATNKSRQLDADTQAAAWWDLGLAYEYSNKFDDARSAIQAAVRLDPQDEMFEEELKAIEQNRADHTELKAQLGM